MGQKPKKSKENSNKETSPKIRRLFSSEQKVAIVMEAKRGEYSIVELCLKHCISEATLNKWNKDFIKANKYKIF
jgi:transposase